MIYPIILTLFTNSKVSRTSTEPCILFSKLYKERPINFEKNSEFVDFQSTAYFSQCDISWFGYQLRKLICYSSVDD